MRAVAKRAGMSEAHYRVIERGYRIDHGMALPPGVSRQALIDVAIALDMDPNLLMKELGWPLYRPGKKPRTDGEPLDVATQLARLREGQDHLIGLVEEFIDAFKRRGPRA